MIIRLGYVLLAFALLLDGVACFFWLAPLYLVGLADRPSGHQLISAYVGRAAINGQAWALRTEAAIDDIFGPQHCLRAARHYAGFAD